MAGIVDTLGWAATKTWSATKVTLKLMTNAGGSHLDSGKSLFDHNFEQTSLYHLTTEKQYEKNATDLDNTADILLSNVRRPGGLDCLDGLKIYADKRAKALTEMCKKNNIDAVPDLRDNTLTEKLTTEIATLAALKKQIRDEITSAQIRPFSLVNKLEETKVHAMKALNSQFENDKKFINELTDTPDITGANGTVTKGTVYGAAVKNEMIEVLEQNHKAALKKFEETMNEQIKIQLNNARFENARLALIRMWNEKGSAEMQEQLRQAALHNKDATTVNFYPENAIEQADFKQIRKFKTLSGLAVVQNDKGALELKIPGRFWAPIYHNGLQDNIKADLKLLALTIKATGASVITINLAGQNQADIKLIAKKAVLASIEAGFTLGNGKKEVTLDADGNKYTESKQEKEARLGSIRIMNNGELMPLLSEVDKEGKVTKEGIFSSQQELDIYLDNQNIAKKEREEYEKRHGWVGDVQEVVLSDEQEIVLEPTAGASAPVPTDLSGIEINGNGDESGRTRQFRNVVQARRHQNAENIEQDDLSIEGGETHQMRL